MAIKLKSIDEILESKMTPDDMKKELLKGLAKNRGELTKISRDIANIRSTASEYKFGDIEKISAEIEKELDSIRNSIIKFERK